MNRHGAALVIGVVAGVGILAVAGAATRPSGSGPGRGAPWVSYVAAVDGAVAQRDLAGAIQAWHDAYSAALGSRGWQGMVDVGDASLRLAEIAPAPAAFESHARQSYLAALQRARSQHSIQGALRTAQAFSALGDRDSVTKSVRIAEALVALSGDVESRDRLRAAKDRLAASLESR